MSQFLKLLVGKAYLNFALDLKWLAKAPVSASDRLVFLMEKYRCILSNARKMNFLGGVFSYDNRLMPALLSEYVFEINDISKYVDFSKLKTVFDIGANAGQFGYAAIKLYPHLSVYSFEPNTVIYPLLERNAESFRSWQVFNIGIGRKDEIVDFHFVEGKSGQGSLYPANAAIGLLSNRTRKIQVQIRSLSQSLLQSLHIPDSIDFVKIDVEGAEGSVLETVKDLRWQYLFVELSSGRDGGLSIEQALKILGPSPDNAIEVIYSSVPQGPSQTYQLLMHRTQAGVI